MACLPPAHTVLNMASTTAYHAPPVATGASGAPAPEQMLDAVIIGAGFGGIAAAIKLRDAGFRDVVVLEKGPDVGGCWRENTYPGCACDVPSHLYSYSFAPNPDWTRQYAPQAEIEQYVRDTVDAYNVRRDIRFGVQASGAAWDDTVQGWRLETSDGPLLARVMISAAGPLHQPLIPDIPGLADFPGTVFHSAGWDHGHDLTGERVAVIGSGASAIQFVPEIAPKVGRLELFQRTPPWLLPRVDFQIPRWARWAHRRIPGLRRAHRLAIFSVAETLGFAQRHPRFIAPLRAAATKHLHAQVKDPALRERLTPDYAPGCKRILFANTWYPALQRDNVDVISSGVAEVRGNTVIASDGTEREVDTIILATGFHVTDPPTATAVRGPDGRSMADTWGGSPQAYLGTTVAGFPNLFLLVGPNSALGHSSIIFVIEQQVHYAVEAMKHMRFHALGRIEVDRAVQEQYLARVDERLKDAVWATGGCGSYYLDATGRTSTIWPWSLPRMQHMLRRFDAEHYRVERRVPVTTPQAGRGPAPI